jgi:hypothetical protein
MASAAMGLQALGTGVQLIGNKVQADAEIEVANYNADTALREALQTEEQGAELERRSRVESGKALGAAEAAYGASGVSGVSAQAVLRNSAAQGELDALTIKHSADLKAYALRRGAGLDKMRAGNIEKALMWQQIGTVVGGASKMMASK